MTTEARDRQIQRQVAKAGRVPSIRAMARTLGTDPRTIRRAYRRLGLQSTARPGRPGIGGVVVHLRLPVDLYDSACRVALHHGADVVAVVRQAAVSGLTAIAHGPYSRS